jgi:hypothetical protein
MISRLLAWLFPEPSPTERAAAWLASELTRPEGRDLLGEYLGECDEGGSPIAPADLDTSPKGLTRDLSSYPSWLARYPS